MRNKYKKVLLGCSTALFSVVLSIDAAMAAGACLASDCTGYTKTSAQCSGKTAIRCPFDTSKYYCQDDVDIPCGDAYQYDCTGTGYIGGSGSECGGKYASCECDTSLDYAWNGSSCSSTCDSSVYKYTCSGSQEQGYDSNKCGTMYSQCGCSSGYHWAVNPSDSYGNSQCMPDTYTLEVCIKKDSNTYYLTGGGGFDATVNINGSTSTASGPYYGSSDTSYKCTTFKVYANDTVKVSFYGKNSAGSSCQAYEATTSLSGGSGVYSSCKKGQYSQQVEMTISGFYYMSNGSKVTLNISHTYSQWASCGEISVYGCSGPFS